MLVFPTVSVFTTHGSGPAALAAKMLKAGHLLVQRPPAPSPRRVRCRRDNAARSPKAVNQCGQAGAKGGGISRSSGRPENEVPFSKLRLRFVGEINKDRCVYSRWPRRSAPFRANSKNRLGWLGFLNTYRNLCVAPSAELRVLFGQMREGYVELGNE
jgi:hypothetical protein